MRTFSAGDAGRKVRTKYGRAPNLDTLRRVARRKYGQAEGLSGRQLVELINSLNLRHLPLTPGKRAQLVRALTQNQSLPPYERKSFAQISASLTHPRAPVGSSALKRLNAVIRQSISAAGGKPKKFMATANNSRSIVVQDLRALLSKNIHLSFSEVLAKLQLSGKQLQRVLPHYGTSFKKEVARAAKNAIERLDASTGRSLSNKEIAARLGLKESRVMDYRVRRGRGAGAEVRLKNLGKEFLSLMAAFTTPEAGEISFHMLRALSGANKLSAQGAISYLKKEKLIYEVDGKGSGVYCVSPRGVRFLNSNGHDPRERARRISEMSVPDLQKVLERLTQARRLAGAGVPSSVIQLFEKVIAQKRLSKL